jgi:GxxExxY protein
MHINDISGSIVDSAFRVHKTLGPGLLESTYEACLKYELQNRNIKVLSQVALPVNYNGIKIDAGYRIDLLVENKIIVELKSVEKMLPIHEAQLLTYLKLSKLKLGLLINFNVDLIKNGIKRMVNNI